MKKTFLLVAIVSLALGVIGMAAPSGVAQAQDDPTTACELMNDPWWDGGVWEWAQWPVDPALSFYAGETVIISAGPPHEYEVLPTLFGFRLDGALIASAAYPGTLTYTFTQNMTAQEFWVGNEDGMANVTWEVECAPAAPGCDLAIPIPSTAVVGAFVADAPTYYEPGKLTNPVVTIAAENTAWVLGVDASGMYYKIVWVCQYLWVPVSSMGPNYDAVWNGTPLPTGVVE